MVSLVYLDRWLLSTLRCLLMATRSGNQLRIIFSYTHPRSNKRTLRSNIATQTPLLREHGLAVH